MSEQLSIRGELLAVNKSLDGIAIRINASVGTVAPKQLLRDLLAQTQAMAGAMQRMAIDLGFPVSGDGSPFRVMIAPERIDTIIPEVQPLGEWDFAGRGHVISCIFPFDCSHADAVGKHIRAGGDIWRVRGVERGGPDMGKGRPVGLLVSLVMGGTIRSAEPPFDCVFPDVLKAQEPIYLTPRERAFAAAAIQFVGDNMPEEAGDLLPDLNETEVADLVSVLKVED